jgi:hypothetical protein
MLIHRSLKLFVPIFFSALVCSPSLGDEGNDSRAKRPKPKVMISKETTFITEPLQADGTVDFVAALNRRCSQGVTPENNAAIPFWQAVGPKKIDGEIRKQYFQLLGIAELPETDGYLLPLVEFLPRYKGPKPPEQDASETDAWEETAYRQFELAQKAPWPKEKYPVIAALLEQNAKPLDIFVEAAHRPRYYSPLVPTDGKSRMATGLNLPEIPLSREIVRCLMARAMLRLHENDVAGAVKDALACDRWGRLRSQGPFLVDQLLATVHEGSAFKFWVALARRDSVDVGQIAAAQAELVLSPHNVPVVQAIAFGERLFGLGLLWDMAINQSRWFETNVAAGVPIDVLSLLGLDKSEIDLLRRLAADPQTDWDEVFRYQNQCYDRIVAAWAAKPTARRRQLLAKFDEEMGSLKEEAPAALTERSSTYSKAVSRARARQFVHLVWSLPAAHLLNVEGNRQTYRNLAVLALALRRFQIDHHRYPKSLAELSPAYLAEIPKDVFTDGDLHYRSDGKGYTLYSVGMNGKDDAGRNYLEEHDYKAPIDDTSNEQEKSTDDIVIRTPGRRDAGK